MSKFNSRTPERPDNFDTTNKSGLAAYSYSDKEKLTFMVLTSMFNEDKYYGDNSNELIELAERFAKTDPEYLMKLTCYARNVANLRSVSHALTAVIARHAHEYTRRTIRNVIVRPDDILEIMSCFKDFYDTNFPNAMKREIGDCMNHIDEHAFAKYNSTNRNIRFKNVLQIVHPKPADEKQDKIFNKIMNDKLDIPYTWETELSAKGNNKEVWNDLLYSNKLGYMATLRNLHNIYKSGADIDYALEHIEDGDAVRKSKQLPFRFLSAYRTLKSRGECTYEMQQSLNRALVHSIDSLPRLKGNTFIAIDNSGSMDMHLTEKGSTTCYYIGCTIGMLANKICEHADVVLFNNDATPLEYDKSKSILANIDNMPCACGGTNLGAAFGYMLNMDTVYDRVIIISDNEINCAWENKPSCIGYINAYRRKKNRNLWVHGIDIVGYGTTQFRGNRVNLISGWNDNVLSFIDLAERGISNLVSEIENYKVN